MQSSPCFSIVQIQEMLEMDTQEDGRFYNFDVRIISYFKGSDHFDPDHYNYYIPYDSYFKRRKERFRTEREEVEYRDGKENLRAINETNRVSAFNRLKTLFENWIFEGVQGRKLYHRKFG